MQSLMQIFGLLTPKLKHESSADNLSSSGSLAKENPMLKKSTTQGPLDTRFADIKYEKDDWFIMLLSELIFDQLKRRKPDIKLDYVPLIEEEEGEELDFDMPLTKAGKLTVIEEVRQPSEDPSEEEKAKEA